jgi:hypothetical protein
MIRNSYGIKLKRIPLWAPHEHPIRRRRGKGWDKVKVCQRCILVPMYGAMRAYSAMADQFLIGCHARDTRHLSDARQQRAWSVVHVPSGGVCWARSYNAACGLVHRMMTGAEDESGNGAIIRARDHFVIMLRSYCCRFLIHPQSGRTERRRVQIAGEVLYQRPSGAGAAGASARCARWWLRGPERPVTGVELVELAQVQERSMSMEAEV